MGNDEGRKKQKKVLNLAVDLAQIAIQSKMSKRPVPFTEAAIRRAIRAVSKERAQVEIRIEPSGAIRILPYSAPEPARNDASSKSAIRESRIVL